VAPIREIRADFDRRTVVVYQAYSPAIAQAALEHQRLVPPFSLQRMTWIKPSFLWLMHRSSWARSPNQERILAVRISRAGWEEALGLAVLSHFEPTSVHRTPERWQEALEASPVRVQWDPERALRGGPLGWSAIQVGLGRGIVERYATSWVEEITELTGTAHRVQALLTAGQAASARRLLPPERPYPLEDRLRAHLGI